MDLKPRKMGLKPNIKLAEVSSQDQYKVVSLYHKLKNGASFTEFLRGDRVKTSRKTTFVAAAKPFRVGNTLFVDEQDRFSYFRPSSTSSFLTRLLDGSDNVLCPYLSA
jgi:hypothetical protein